MLEKIPLESTPTIIGHWRTALLRVLTRFEEIRGATNYFYAKTFAIFVLLNLTCFWWALLTTYPEYVFSYKAEEYVLMGFPVALFGALFDCLSLLVTIFIIKRALASTNNSSYIFYLTIDFNILVSGHA